jgi:endonuclease/exonuclease/phosphatase family metal-dependent hydrolase
VGKTNDRIDHENSLHLKKKRIIIPASLNLSKDFLMSTIALPLSQPSTAGCDRSFLYASSLLAEPFCKAYELIRYRLFSPLDSEKFSNYPLIQEIAFRALIGSGTALAIYGAAHIPLAFTAAVLTIGIGVKILRAIGFALQENGYTHVTTEAPEIPLGERTTVLTQNFCGIEGGMHYDHGGVISWADRLDEFVALLRQKRPHVIILQEIYTTALAEALVEKLGDLYPHFFMHLGANVMGSVGGVMMITDHPVDAFSNIAFDNNDWTLNRTFAVMDIRNLRIIGTHLIHGEDSQEERREQIAQMLHFIANQENGKITVIGADFNVERDREGRELLTPYLEHGYKGIEPTCTSKLVEQWTGIAREEELIDNISQVKAVLLPDGRRLPVFEEFRLEEEELLPAFDDTYNTKKARSDHHGIQVTIRTGI